MTPPRRASVKEKGIVATVQIETYDDDPDFVTISLFVRPRAPGIDDLAYQRVQKIPEGSRSS